MYGCQEKQTDGEVEFIENKTPSIGDDVLGYCPSMDFYNEETVKVLCV